MLQLTAVLLDCTLMPDPMPSEIEPRLRTALERYAAMDVAGELVRVTNFAVRFGLTSDEGSGDEWPLILARIKAADIIVFGVPTRFGVGASVARMVIDRLEGTIDESNEVGQNPLYNKVFGVVRNQESAGDTLAADMSRLGCTVVPNADADNEHTTKLMALNTVHLARLLKTQQFPAPVSPLDEGNGPNPLPHKLFGDLATGTEDLDPSAVEADRLSAEEGRLLERRRLLDLTWREKGLPEKRAPRPPLDPTTGDFPQS
ncbi:MAG: NAD(P)H-dependent oxidoreductase [Actinomycetota bacterium]